MDAVHFLYDATQPPERSPCTGCPNRNTAHCPCDLLLKLIGPEEPQRPKKEVLSTDLVAIAESNGRPGDRAAWELCEPYLLRVRASHREVLTLNLRDSLSVTQIAERLDRAKSSISERLARALNKIFELRRDDARQSSRGEEDEE